MRDVPRRRLVRDRSVRSPDAWFSLLALAVLVLCSPVGLIPFSMAGHVAGGDFGAAVVAILNLGVIYLGIIALKRRWAILRHSGDNR